MATVVDSFVVTLGLDPAAFTKGQKEATTAFAKTKDEVVKSGKAMEEASQKAADSIGQISKAALSLFAVFMGARGIKEFVADVTSANAALGRMAYNLNVTPQSLSGWEMAARRLGGTNEATAQTIERVSKTLFDLQNGARQMPNEFYRLQAAAGKNIDVWHGPEQYLNGLAAALQKVAATDPGKAHQFAQALGIDDATALLMEKQGGAVGAYTSALGKALGPTQEMIDNSAKLQSSWVALQETAASLGNEVAMKLTPFLVPLLDRMAAWLQANRPAIDAAMEKFGKALQNVDWQQVGTDIATVMTNADHVASALGGWTTAVEAFFLLWTGAKFAQVIANMRIAAAAGGGGRGGGLFRMAVAGYGVDQALRAIDPQDKAGNFMDQHVPGASWLDNLASKIGMGRSYDEQRAAGVTFDGTAVSKANPLPVAPIGGQADATGRGLGGSTGPGLSGGGGEGSTMPRPGGGGTGSASAASTPAVAGTAATTPGTGGSRSWRNNNPGNIEYGAFARSMGATGTDGRFAIFPSYQAGRKAQEGLLFNSSGYRNLTLSQAIGRWAPGSENNVPAYIAAMHADPNAVMSSFSPDQRASLLDAMQAHEGWRAGSRPARQTSADAPAAGVPNLWSGSGGAPLNTPPTGAAGAATTGGSAGGGTPQRQSSNSTHIGAVTIHTAATDARGIARSLTSELKKTLSSRNANFGLA